MLTHYDVLSIPRNAGDEQIRAAYRNLAKTCHPDLNPGDANALKLFKQITDAYKLLLDPLQRDAYDKQLKKEDERKLETTSAASKQPQPAIVRKRRSFSGAVAQYGAIATAAVGVQLAAVSYVDDHPRTIDWRDLGGSKASQSYGVTPATAAETPSANARLFVAGGQAPMNFAVPLVIALQGSVGPDATILIQGLPNGSSLSSGQAVGVNGWLIPVSDLFNLNIRAPQDFAGAIDLIVELHLADGALADRRPLRVWWVGTSVATAPAFPVTPPAAPQSVLPPPAVPLASLDNKGQGALTVVQESQTIAVSKKSNLNDAFRDCQGCPEMISIKGGIFSMGGNDDPTEKPVHHVTVTPFSLSRFPVTVKEWRQCVDAKACAYEPNGEGDTPVRNLSWDDAQQYVSWLSKVTQQKYRLPSEAEWEFAARAKTTTKYWWGNHLVSGMANCSACGEPYSQNDPVKVGSFAPNPLGLYDTAGGISQWVSDCWHDTYSGAPSDGSSWNAANGSICREHVLRGGSWLSDASELRPTNREHYDASVRYPTHGLRVARSSSEPQQLSSGN